jgi:hypothetical protein
MLPCPTKKPDTCNSCEYLLFEHKNIVQYYGTDKVYSALLLMLLVIYSDSRNFYLNNHCLCTLAMMLKTKMHEEAKLYIFIELVTKGYHSSLYQKYKLWDSQVFAYTRKILNGLDLPTGNWFMFEISVLTILLLNKVVLWTTFSIMNNVEQEVWVFDLICYTLKFE